MKADIQESYGLPPSIVLPILAVDAAILFFTAKKRPYIPLMMIFALSPFQHDMSIGGPLRFSLAEINLLLTSVIFLFRRRQILWGPTAVPIALYLVACLISTLMGWRPSTLTSIVQIGLYLVAAVVVFTSFGRDEEDFRPALYGLLFTGLILAIAVVVFRSGYVLGLHKNGVGDSLAAAVIVCGELWFATTERKRRIILSVVMSILTIGLFFTLSRGAWIGASIGLMVILAMRRQFRLLLRSSLILVPLLALCWRFLPEQDRSYTTGLTKENWNIKMRYESLYFAQNRFYESPLIGVGVGLRKEYDATNVFWLTLAETGILGMLTFLGLHVAFLRMVWKTQKRLDRTELLYSVVAIGGALVTSKLIHGMVDHYWSRGAIMAAWASAGMATYGYFVMRYRLRAARDEEMFPVSLQPA